VVYPLGGVPLNPPSPSTPTWPRSAVWALRTTVIGIAVYIVLDIVAQLLPPHYSPISQAESDLGVGPYGWVMDVNFVVRGVLSLAFVYGLYRVWPKTPAVPRTSLALIGAWGVGAFVLAVSPTDVSGPATLHGTVHLVTAFLAFLFVAVGVVGVARSLPETSPWQSIRPSAHAIALLTAAALVVLFMGTGIPRIESHLFGLLERVFIGFALLWMLLVSVYLLRSESRRSQAPSTSA
jgi:hypothetical membrane protein